MPKPYPSEFRDDVVRVARNHEPGVTIEQAARDFGVHPMTLRKWLRSADVEEGARPGQARSEASELREAWKRIRLLEQENEVLRRATAYLSQANLPGKRLYPLVTELAADGVPVAVTCRLVQLSRQPYYRWLARSVTTAEITWAYRANALFTVHADDPEFGHRLLADEARTSGEPMADRTAWRICRQNGWWSAFGRRQAAAGRRPGRRCMMISSDATSPPRDPTSCG